MRLIKRAALVVALMVSATATFAADNEFGLALTKAKVDSESLDSGYKLFYSHMFNNNFGLEVAYGKYGEYNSSTYIWNAGIVDYSVDFTSTNIAMLGAVPMGDMSAFYGKIGVADWSADVDVQGYSGANVSDGTDLLYGLGFKIGASESMAFTLEYEVIDADDSDVKSVNAGVGFRF